jgi:hypothetical protein
VPARSARASRASLALPDGHPLIEKPFTADLPVSRVREALDAAAPGVPAA